MGGRINPEIAFARFEAKVVRGTGNDCWEWTGCHIPLGYAVFGCDGLRYAHRWSYTHFVDVIPDGMEIDHLCRNRGCINPEHLDVTTHRENALRGDGAFARKHRARLQRGGQFLSVKSKDLIRNPEHPVTCPPSCYECVLETNVRFYHQQKQVRAERFSHLREAMKNQGVSIKDVARRSGVLPGAVYGLFVRFTSPEREALITNAITELLLSESKAA